MYSVILEKKVKEYLKKLDKPRSGIIVKKLEGLVANPYLGKPLIGDLKGQWSLRIGKYRAIYVIKDKELIVLMLKIGHKKSSY